MEESGGAKDVRDWVFLDDAQYQGYIFKCERLNCPIERGDVKWVLHMVSGDIVILQESKIEDISHPITISLKGHHRVQQLFLMLVGRSKGIVTIWDPQSFQLLDLRIGSFSSYCKFKSL